MSSVTSTSPLTSSLSKDNVAYLDNLMQNEKTNSLKANQDMGRDQFLHILLTQLANQNPLDPLQDKDFIAQMAQFSSLESMQSLNANFETMMADVKALKDIVATGTDKQDSESEDIKDLIAAMNTQNTALKEISDALDIMKTIQLEQLNLLMSQAQANQAYGE